MGPAEMHAIGELGRIALGPLGVRTLDTDMLVGAVAYARNMHETISIAGNGPRFLERNPLCAWRTANQPVHTASR